MNFFPFKVVLNMFSLVFEYYNNAIGFDFKENFLTFAFSEPKRESELERESWQAEREREKREREKRERNERKRKKGKGNGSKKWCMLFLILSFNF